MKKNTTMILATLVCFGCGGSDGGPGGAVDVGGIGDDLPTLTGEGSNSLRVEARIEATPDGEEALSADVADTDFEIDVFDAAGVAVTGATVIVESALGPVTLSEGGCERRYCGSQRGYSRTYAVSISADDDFVDGLRLSGPAFHTVTAPEAGSQVDPTMPLTITWSPSGQADRTRLETRDFEIEMAGDPGSYELAADTLRSRADEPEDERIRVRRERETPIAGALGSSTLVVFIRNGVEFETRIP